MTSFEEAEDASKGPPTLPKKRRLEETEDIKEKRKPGRPVTTGEYDIKLAMEATRHTERKEKEERETFNSRIPMPDSQAWKRLEIKTAEFVDERMTPSWTGLRHGS